MSIRLSERSICDLDVLAKGGFSLLDRFMRESDYKRVVKGMRLVNGTLFSLPATLPTARLNGLKEDQEVALRDAKNELLAVMDEAFEWDRAEETLCVLGRMDFRHPLVGEMVSWGNYYLSELLKVVKIPQQRSCADLRGTPTEVRRFCQRARGQTKEVEHNV